MNADKLLARRTEVVERHKVLESVPGSGWHKDDPQRRGSEVPPPSERPVAIQDDDRVHFVGPCADAVRAAAQKAVEEFCPPGEDDGPSSPIAIHSLKVARRVAESTGDIELGTQDFNGLALAIRHVKVTVCLTALKG
jgi:hypothetical protein